MARIVLDDLVETFKNAWEAADADGQEGARSRAGLEEVLESLDLADGDVVVGQPGEVQNVVLFVGDALPVFVEDDASARDLRSLFDSPVQRAVTVARLRTIAHLLEQDPVQGGES